MHTRYEYQASYSSITGTVVLIPVLRLCNGGNIYQVPGSSRRLRGYKRAPALRVEDLHRRYRLLCIISVPRNDSALSAAYARYIASEAVGMSLLVPGNATEEAESCVWDLVPVRGRL